MLLIMSSILGFVFPVSLFVTLSLFVILSSFIMLLLFAMFQLSGQTDEEEEAFFINYQSREFMQYDICDILK